MGKLMSISIRHNRRHSATKMKQMNKLGILVVVVLCATMSFSQAPQTISVPPDSPRWEFEGNVNVADYLNRKCLRLDGAAAVLKDFEMRDGVIDVDVATPAKRGFFGFDVRIDKDGAN